MAKAKKKRECVCMADGYAYELDNPKKRNWRIASDDYWEIVMQSGEPAKLLGRRNIDGADCIVMQRGRKIYAQTAISVKKC